IVLVRPPATARHLDGELTELARRSPEYERGDAATRERQGARRKIDRVLPQPKRDFPPAQRFVVVDSGCRFRGASRALRHQHPFASNGVDWKRWRLARKASPACRCLEENPLMTEKLVCAPLGDCGCSPSSSPPAPRPELSTR